MAVVTLRVGGKDYQVACDNGEEEQLRRLGDEIDDRVQSLIYRMRSNPGESMGLLLTCLTMADELAELKRETSEPQQVLNGENDAKIAQIEAAMVSTLDEIAERIERIAARVEMG